MTDESASPRLVHSTVLDYKGSVLMLRGDSGAGKSDLALRLIAVGAKLIGDDYVQVKAHSDSSGENLLVQAAPQLHGMMEVRGVGLVYVAEVMPLDGVYPVELVVDLVPRAEVPRMPDGEDQVVDIEGILLRRIKLHAFDGSTPLKIALACGHSIA